MIRYAIEHLRSWKKGLSFILFRFPSGHDWRREEKTRKMPFSPFSQCHSSGGVAYFFLSLCHCARFCFVAAAAWLFTCACIFVALYCIFYLAAGIYCPPPHFGPFLLWDPTSEKWVSVWYSTFGRKWGLASLFLVFFLAFLCVERTSCSAANIEEKEHLLLSLFFFDPGSTKKVVLQRASTEKAQVHQFHFLLSSPPLLHWRYRSV